MQQRSVYENLVELLRARAEHSPERVIYTFLGARGEALDVTYAELDLRARAIAVNLLGFMRPGERVLQVFPTGADFLFAFFGAMYAGVIGVPLPRPGKPNEVRRLNSTATASQARCVMTTRETIAEVAELGGEWANESLRAVVPSEVDLRMAEDFRMPSVQSDSLAYLQFTSGSTGLPKGVMITHRNILANEEMIRLAFEHDAASTFVGWLPHSHDMGLIGNILQPLYINSRSVLMSPSTFIRDPLRWLRAVSAYQAHTSGGPNFAYDLCVQSLARSGLQTDLDLSSWKVAFVGSEPIRARTLDAFAEAFAPYGFQKTSLFPCYGLAEATLLATGEKKGAGPQQASMLTDGVVAKARARLVSSGAAAPLQTLKIVDPHTRIECADGEEGEIWISGPHVAEGYWGLDAETAATFGATLRDATGTFLRTGDLAIRKCDATYVTGRLRDLIILRGNNYYPQDIEASAEQSGRGVRIGASAAFAFSYEESECIALAIESDGSMLEDHLLGLVAERVREAVQANCGLRLDVIAIIAKGSLHKTTSGKVERRAMCQAFLSGTLPVLHYTSLLTENDELWDRSYRLLRIAAPAMAPPALAYP